MKLAVIGSSNVDLTSYIDRMPVWGETLEAPAFSLGHGGKGANQAVAAARYGADVWMVTKVGDDIFAEATIGNFKAQGIHADYVRKVKGESSGVAPIFVDKEGHNSILIIKGANNRLAPADIDEAARDIQNADLLILQLEISLATVYYAVSFGKKYGIPVLLNPAPASKDLDLDKVRDVTFFMPNETELQILTGMPVHTVAEAEVAAKSLVAKGIKNVIVTLGEKGALWVADGVKELVPPQKVQAVDTSGAGDAFIGCFAASWSKSHDIKAAMQEASCYAALSVMRKGTQKSYPTKAALMAFVEGKK